MMDKPLEEELNKLQESLSYLADIIGKGLKPDKSTIKDILSKVNYNGNLEWAIGVVDQVIPIMERATKDTNNTDKEEIIADFESLGIKHFPAILAFEKLKPVKLTIEPQFIDFGCLKPDENGNATIKITGGRIEGKVQASRQIIANLVNTDEKNAILKLTLTAGSIGQSFSGQIVLQSKNNEFTIPVKAEWGISCPFCGNRNMKVLVIDKKPKYLACNCPKGSKIVFPMDFWKHDR
jgi:hypothetical protein